MKTVRHLLPVGIPIDEVAVWCRDNSIPALFQFGDQKPMRIKRWLGWWDYTNSYDEDTLIVRESDYTLVRLRF